MGKDDEDIVSYRAKQFFEELLRTHTEIADFTKISHREYRVSRKRGDAVNVCLSGKYLLGLFDYWRLKKECPTLSMIVHVSQWKSSTSEAKVTARKEQVGIFHVKEFMGALSWEKHWLYEAKEK